MNLDENAYEGFGDVYPVAVILRLTPDDRDLLDHSEVDEYAALEVTADEIIEEALAEWRAGREPEPRVIVEHAPAGYEGEPHASIKAISFGDYPVWEDAVGIPSNVASATGFLRGIVKGVKVRGGMDITVEANGGGTLTAVFIGLKPQTPGIVDRLRSTFPQASRTAPYATAWKWVKCVLVGNVHLDGGPGTLCIQPAFDFVAQDVSFEVSK